MRSHFTSAVLAVVSVLFLSSPALGEPGLRPVEEQTGVEAAASPCRKMTIQAMDLEDKKWLHVKASGKTSPHAKSDNDDSVTPGRWDYQVATYIFHEFTRNLEDLLAEQNEVAPE